MVIPIQDHETGRGRAGSGRFRGHLLLPLLMLLASLLVAAAAVGQNRDGETSPQQAMAQAEAVLSRAEKGLAQPKTSLTELRDYRRQLASLRDISRDVAGKGSLEGRTIQAQIDGLGPPPDEGKTESAEVAKRRAGLLAELGRAEEPIRLANQVLRQTEVLLREVDLRIRDLETTALFLRNPTPLLPSAWVTAVTELAAYGREVQKELTAFWHQPAEVERQKENIPTAIFLALLALILLFVAYPRVLFRLERTSVSPGTRTKRWFLVGLKNLLRFALPGISGGLLLLILHLLLGNFVPWQGIVAIFPKIVALPVIAHWLGHTIFSPNSPGERLLTLDDHRARSGYRLCLGLGLLLTLQLLVGGLIKSSLFQNSTFSVLATPPLLFACLLLWQLGRLLRGKSSEVPPATGPAQVEEERQTLDAGFLRQLAWVMQMAAAVIPLLVALGFMQLSIKAVDAIIGTVMLLGLALLLYHVAVIILQATLAGDDAPEATSLPLLPVCVISLLAILFLPLLAMVWGASGEDLLEIWRLFTDGVQLGGIRISLGMLVTLIVVFTIGVIFTRWLQRLMRLSVLPRTTIDRGAQTSLVTGIGYLGLTLTTLIAVSSAGLDLSNLAVVAGALSLGIGFGLQAIVSNFVSGIILLVERPIKEGDWVEVSGYSGYVRKISVRATRIETFDRHDVVLPNSELISGAVKNMTLSNMTGRLLVPVGVAYGSDLEKTRQIMLAAAREHPGVIPDPAPGVLFVGLGDSSLDFELRCFLRDIGQTVMIKSDLLMTIYTRLNEEKIEIPFPQRDIHLRDIDRLVEAIAGRLGAAARQGGNGTTPGDSGKEG
jgi:potassium-dependent mechanosensitive channel